MDRTNRQTPIEISETEFPRFDNSAGKPTERFWFIKDEFIKHSKNLLTNGQIFSHISARLVNNRWVCDVNPVSGSAVSSFIMEMRLFYMKNESMSIYSFCTYMEKNIDNVNVQKFFNHMRESWDDNLQRNVSSSITYPGQINTNKQLIDAVLYGGSFHSQEKYKKRYDELLEHMDENLILMNAYNAMHSGYQMNQISRAISKLSKDNLVIMLPDHLRHEWDENCPYKVKK